jgi:hypothetical protein
MPETLRNTSLAAGMTAPALMSIQAAAQLTGLSGDRRWDGITEEQG